MQILCGYEAIRLAYGEEAAKAIGGTVVRLPPELPKDTTASPASSAPCTPLPKD